MHSHSLDQWTHKHVFLGQAHSRNERRTWLVVALTAAMMVGEIAGGMLFGSMALLADGWHMATHAAALTIAVVGLAVNVLSAWLLRDDDHHHGHDHDHAQDHDHSHHRDNNLRAAYIH